MADAQPSTLSGTFHRPFNEQVAFFRGKLGNLVPTRWWDDLQKSQHDSAFMVAGAARMDLLSALAVAVDRAIAEGTSIEKFRQDFREIVARTGWTGWTGEDTPQGRAWRTRTIYVTNTKTAYHAGRLAQLRAGNYPLWVYRHNDSVRHPRPHHVSWNGITLPPDHNWWRTHYTPNGWGCECYIVGARSEAAARRLGGDPGKKLPEGWDRIDIKTGEQPGIDKGWGYMPGDTVSDTVREMAAKTQQWEYSLAKAYMQNVPTGTRDALVTEYRNLPSVADDIRRYAQRVLAGSDSVEPYRTLGLLTRGQAHEIGQLVDIGVDLFDFAFDASAVLHIQDKHGSAGTEAARGQRAVGATDYRLLPSIINSPDAVEAAGEANRTRNPLVQFVKIIGGQRYVAVFEVRKGRRMLALQTFWIRGAGAAPA